ncbi:hypothetical protein JTB14_005139 [Gonioctena quinquepunctata]|nr:hypothetical protein JTB14_005139 [Gonioctena quinquepunctata]
MNPKKDNFCGFAVDKHAKQGALHKKLSREAVSNSCKRKAVEDICERPSKIMTKDLANSVYKDNLTTRDLEFIRHNINRKRQQILPTLPKNIGDKVVSELNLLTGR